MTPDKFKTIQKALGWTNSRMATYLRKTDQSVSNYRNGRQKIPEHVVVLLQMAQKDAENSSRSGALGIAPHGGRAAT